MIQQIVQQLLLALLVLLVPLAVAYLIFRGPRGDDGDEL